MPAVTHGSAYKLSTCRRLQDKCMLTITADGAWLCLAQKEEEVQKMQAELESLIAGVAAARHEQQRERRHISQLKHECEDTLQAS